MKRARITRGGQVSVPAEIRRRWQTNTVAIEDLGDRLVMRPLPDDPIAALRGAFKGRVSSEGLREAARRDEEAAERRRWSRS
jgi:bifunctional DNA-binding transcriptional regulator/antitoxin component of YhaV-PrlF toxin-antitoxin module